MNEIWERLEEFLKKNLPAVYAGLPPGATEDEIAAVEAGCGFAFPADVRQFYLRHNGQSLNEEWDQGGTFIPCCFGLLPLARVLDEWQGNLDTIEMIQDDMPGGESAGPAVKDVFLDPAWVPFAKDIGGNQVCLDFDPGPGGQVGQIVEFDHESYGQRCLGPDFRTWVETIMSDLESGRCVWSEEVEGYCYPEEN